MIKKKIKLIFFYSKKKLNVHKKKILIIFQETYKNTFNNLQFQVFIFN